ncbi:MAG TPA: GntR family transcriptional regulator [Allosphingosinicella sp.]|jgi:DNA-binding GntR family transcriptional regulator
MQRVADRTNLSDALASEVRTMILDGALAAGERINEVHLAARLGVSRTPLREALMRLVSEGAVTSVARLGFYVVPLTAEELQYLYPVRGILDPAALRMGGLPPPGRIARLKALNAELQAARDPVEAVRIDDAWHFELIAGCGNPVLIGFIEQMMWRTRRYELGLMRGRTNVEHSTEDHDRVIAALEAGDLDAACAALAANMTSGLEPILEWLAERETK